MKKTERLYHVTLQVFGTSGTTLENKYYTLPAPFFPEDAKKAYMKEKEGSVLRRDLIVIVQWSDQEANRDRLDWQTKKDDQLDKKYMDLAKKAADGEYGNGDDSQKVVSLELNKLRKEETADE